MSIVECDLELDFAEPLGYVQPKALPSIGSGGGRAAGSGGGAAGYDPIKKAEAAVAEAEKEVEKEVEKAVFSTFTGGGHRLDGKKIKDAPKEVVPAAAGGVVSKEDAALARRRQMAAAAERRFNVKPRQPI